MNTPVPALMQRYGTEDVFLAKTADSVPLLARMALGLLSVEGAREERGKDERQKEEDVLRAEAQRELALLQMSRTSEPLRHTQVPRPLPNGGVPGVWNGEFVDMNGPEWQVPFDMRLASIAAGAGADLAKEAGIGDFMAAASTAKKWLSGGMGLKKNLALAAGGVGASMLAAKGVGAAAREMGRPPQGPATYGGSVRGVGYELPFGTNQYGVPQVGTQL